MMLTRWNPIREMESLQREMNRIFQPFERVLDPGADPLATSPWMPAVDVEETPEALFVRAEVPGLKPEDIQIEYENGVLTLRGERKFDGEKRDRNFHRIERAYGSFVRSFALPKQIDAERATARYEDGVLELSMPKREESKPRRIEVSGTHKAIDAKAQ